MPFKKGMPRHPNAGRKKGTPNKLDTIEAAMKEIVTADGSPLDPIKVLWDGIMDMPSFQRVDAIVKFLEFLYPKKRQVEHNIDDEQLKEILKQRLAQRKVIDVG